MRRERITLKSILSPIWMCFVLGLIFLIIPSVEAQQKTPPQGGAATNDIKNTERGIIAKDVRLDSIIKIFSRKTNRNYIFDERVQGAVSISLPADKASVKQAAQILDSILQFKGYTSVPIGENLWKIVPAKDAKQTTIPTINEIEGRGSPIMVTRLINLKFVAADDVKQLLGPLISPSGLMNAYTATNSLIIIDAEENIKRLMNLIDEMDVPFSNREMIIIPVKHAVAADLANTIKELLGEGSEQQKSANEQNLDFIRARMQNNMMMGRRRQERMLQANEESAAETVGAARSRAPKILADERTNSIIVVADEDTAARVRALVSELDSSVDMAGMHFYVYKCIHADADELANVLSTVASGGGASNTNSNVSRGSSFSQNQSSNARNRNTSNYRLGGSNNSSSTRTDSATSSGSQSSTSVTFGENLSITSDPATNSLVIYGTKADYDRVLALIKELDVKRRQVLVEALLLEVKISDSMALSSEFITSGGGSDGGVVGMNNLGSISTLLTNPTQLSQFTMAVASAGTLTLPGDITIPTQSMMLSAASQNNRVNVLSAPTILATDNEEAEIIVGENVPFLASTSSSTENLNNTFNQIDRQDVGITLRLTPQISSRDYVKLNIFTEVSNVISDTSTSELGPTTTIRTSQTTVIAKDSQMIVIGGLMGENIEETETGVPYLRNIPILGHLFKGYSTSDDRNNLLIFITPRIIKDQFDIRDNSVEMRDSFDRFMQNKEVHPRRDDVLYNENIDKVVESEIYSGKKPSTILPPLKDDGALSEEDTERLKENVSEPISLRITPHIKTTDKKETVVSQNSVKDPRSLKKSSDLFIVLQAMRGERPSDIPFSITTAGVTGIVIPAESNQLAKSFFQEGGVYQYKMKENNIPLQVVAIFPSKEAATKNYGTLKNSWYTLSPFELIRLGQSPWSKR
ncbi:MAG: type II secretion system secretin GspD [Bdellovibrionota bacterium]|jgi:general secretion pathway protein D